MTGKIITMGEIILRLSPPNNQRLLQSDTLNMDFGGAEANVSVLLGNLGVDNYMISKLPKNDMGKRAIRFLKSNNVNTSYIIEEGERLGLYYLEKGAASRNAKVIYDRKDSSMANTKEGDFDFKEIFKDAEWFHISGITPMLSEGCYNITKEAIMVAKENNVKISVDLNYRSLLGSYGKFKGIMKEIIKDAEVCFGWIEEEKIDDYSPLEYEGEIDYKYFEKVFKYMKEEFNVKNVVTTLRENHSSTKNSLISLGYDGEKIITSKKYTFDLIDRVGAGDAFAGGVLYELLNKSNLEKAINFGIASAVLKHSILGDSSIVQSEDEIYKVMEQQSFGILR